LTRAFALSRHLDVLITADDKDTTTRRELQLDEDSFCALSCYSRVGACFSEE
jgi:hypothetical protein